LNRQRRTRRAAKTTAPASTTAPELIQSATRNRNASCNQKDASETGISVSIQVNEGSQTLGLENRLTSRVLTIDSHAHSPRPGMAKKFQVERSVYPTTPAQRAIHL